VVARSAGRLSIGEREDGGKSVTDPSGRRGGIASSMIVTGDTKAFDITHQWHLEVHALEPRADGGATLVASITSAGLKGKLPPGTSAEVGDVSRPFLFRLGPECAVTEFARYRDAGLGASAMQQVLVRSLQWRYPAGKDEARERDALGRYEARYELREVEGAPEVRRQVLRYTEVDTYLPGRKPYLARRATLTPGGEGLVVRPGPGPWFDTLKESRTVAFESPGKKLGRFSVRTDATRVAPEGTLPEVAVTDPLWVWGDIPALEVAEEALPKPNPAWRQVELSSILERYLAELAKGPNDVAASELLAAWIRANPEQIPALLDLLRGGRFDGRVNAFMRALWAAKTPEAAKALRAVMTDGRFDRDKRNMAMWGLVQSDFHRDELLADLERLAWGGAPGDPNAVPKEDAILALGAFLRDPGDANDAAVDKAIAGFGAKLQRPTDLAELHTTLLGTGNTASDDLYEAVAPLFQHENTAIRLEAARAAAQMSPELTEAAFVRWLAGGDAPEVVAGLATGILSQYGIAGQPIPAEIVNGLIAAFQTAQVPTTRDALLSTLGSAVREGSSAAKQAINAAFMAELAKPEGTRSAQWLRALGAFVDQATMKGLPTK
jgi:hypothetical protein